LLELRAGKPLSAMTVQPSRSTRSSIFGDDAFGDVDRGELERDRSAFWGARRKRAASEHVA
jgi:hypothetical protein